jgi:hypothetical protein
MLVPARLLIFALCGLAGYFVANAFVPSAGLAPEIPPKNSEPAALKPLVGVPEESAMVAEWDQLRKDHGGDTADLQALYAAIKDTKDPYRRRAFRAALIAEWTMKDPRAGLAYLFEKDAGSAGQFMREWMRVDPDGAVTGILAGGAKARGALRSLQSEIARMAPSRLSEVVAALPKAESRWDRTTQDAFAILAETTLRLREAAAESVTGPLRAEAIDWCGEGVGEKDGPAALAWAEGCLAGESARFRASRRADWLAKTDPVPRWRRLISRRRAVTRTTMHRTWEPRSCGSGGSQLGCNDQVGWWITPEARNSSFNGCKDVLSKRARERSRGNIAGNPKQPIARPFSSVRQRHSQRGLHGA